MHLVFASRKYERAYKRIKRHKDFDRAKLEEVIDTLSRGQTLSPKYRDYELAGNLKGSRECHVQNDVLLVYQIIKNKLVLVLVNIGSHSDLF